MDLGQQRLVDLLRPERLAADLGERAVGDPVAAGLDDDDLDMSRRPALGDFQRWLIEVYQASDGWYLFPQWKFMDMAECCMLACVCYAALLLVLLAAWGMRAMKKA